MPGRPLSDGMLPYKTNGIFCGLANHKMFTIANIVFVWFLQLKCKKCKNDNKKQLHIVRAVPRPSPSVSLSGLHLFIHFVMFEFNNKYLHTCLLCFTACNTLLVRSMATAK